MSKRPSFHMKPRRGVMATLVAIVTVASIVLLVSSPVGL